jgi:hypothetical protein
MAAAHPKAGRSSSFYSLPLKQSIKSHETSATTKKMTPLIARQIAGRVSLLIHTISGGATAVEGLTTDACHRA